MAENLILPFAQGQGANVLSQTDYAGDSMRLQGHQPGVARSALENKALLQCSSIAAGLAQFIADRQADNVTDEKTPTEIAGMLATCIVPDSINGTTGYLAIKNTTTRAIYIQWGTALVNIETGTTSGGGTVTFPVAFPTTLYTASMTPNNNFFGSVVANTGGVVCSVYNTTETGFTFQFFPNDKTVNVRGNHYFKWIAIGA